MSAGTLTRDQEQDLEQGEQAARRQPRSEPLQPHVLVMELAPVVHELVGVLGGPDVAVIGGVGSTGLVSDWMNGRARPKTHDREMKLRLALRLTRILRARFRPEAVRAWFWAADDRLDDEAPIGLLTQQPHSEIQKPLLIAARAFVQSVS